MGPADFSEMRTQKEGVFVYQELNIAAQETSENNTETFSGEDKGVMDESKIVPIVNKTNSAEDGYAAATAETAAQMVAQHAALPAESAVLQAAGQTAAPSAGASAAQVQTVPPSAGASAAQVQTTAQDAVQSARQPEGAKAVPTVSGDSGADTGSRTPADDSSAADTGYTAKTEDDSSGRSRKRRSFRFDPDDDFDFDEDERPKKRFFRFRSASDEESRDKMILSRIKDEDLMEYLALEQRRLEFLQQAKEAKEKRILIAFQLLISLAAIVGITYLLQDNPTILISILYIVGIVAALNVWKNPHDRWGKR